MYTYATIATEIDANVTDMCSQAKNVLSLAKKTFGSTFTGTYPIRLTSSSQLKSLSLPYGACYRIQLADMHLLYVQTKNQSVAK